MLLLPSAIAALYERMLRRRQCQPRARWRVPRCAMRDVLLMQRRRVILVTRAKEAARVQRAARDMAHATRGLPYADIRASAGAPARVTLHHIVYRRLMPRYTICHAMVVLLLLPRRCATRAEDIVFATSFFFVSSSRRLLCYISAYFTLFSPSFSLTSYFRALFAASLRRYAITVYGHYDA